MADDLEERLAKRARSDRVGWQGASLELERENPKGEAAAAVDLEQFRNHQVGVGYQAKHVVRQPCEESSKSKKKVHDTKKGKKSLETNKKEITTSDRLSKYLKHEGLRRLRKELEIYK